MKLTLTLASLAVLLGTANVHALPTLNTQGSWQANQAANAHVHKVAQRNSGRAVSARRDKNDVKSKSRKRIAALKALATRTSMKYLPRLRPYSNNYARLVAAVRGYWRRHTANPNASQLTNLILRYVKKEYRMIARPQILAGTRKGVNMLKVALNKK